MQSLVNYLKDIAAGSMRPLDEPETDKIISRQEDASLRSPSVEAHYYRFFYWLSRIMKPSLIVDVGTNTGFSAMCFADGCKEAEVISIDYEPKLLEECRRLNVKYLIQDSLEPIVLEKNIDILFLDTNHDGVRPLKEFEEHSKHMSKVGIIFFDDVYLNEEMKSFWSAFNPAGWVKFDIPVHGEAGFGCLVREEGYEP